MGKSIFILVTVPYLNIRKENQDQSPNSPCTLFPRLLYLVQSF
nr:MAG TPA: hypothetical protein [Caudoviricetes sp.]